MARTARNPSAFTGTDRKWTVAWRPSVMYYCRDLGLSCCLLYLSLYTLGLWSSAFELCTVLEAGEAGSHVGKQVPASRQK